MPSESENKRRLVSGNQLLAYLNMDLEELLEWATCRSAGTILDRDECIIFAKQQSTLDYDGSENPIFNFRLEFTQSNLFSPNFPAIIHIGNLSGQLKASLEVPDDRHSVMLETLRQDVEDWRESWIKIDGQWTPKGGSWATHFSKPESEATR